MIRSLRWLIIPLLVGGIATTPSLGQDKIPPDFKSGVAPGSVDELKAIEKHVQEIIARVTPSVVGVQIGFGQGSGVIVSEDGLVLTAGHVLGKPGQKARVVMPDGTILEAKALGQNQYVDSGMMKIVTAPKDGKFPFTPIGDLTETKKGQWVVAIGHPGGFRKNRTPVVRVGRIVNYNRITTQTDCAIVGGDSGGPLFDMNGKVVGIHSRIGDKAITDNIHVPIDAFRASWKRLLAGEQWGGPIGQQLSYPSFEGKEIFAKKGKLEKTDPPDPAFGGARHKQFSVHLTAGSTYTIDLKTKDRAFDPYLRFEGPDGRIIDENDDGIAPTQSLDSRIVHKATKDGDYRVVVSTLEPEMFGAFHLTVQENPFRQTFESGTVEVFRGAHLPRLTALLIQKQLSEVKVEKRLRVVLNLHALIVDANGDPLANKDVKIRWNGGQQTYKSNFQGVVHWELKKTTSRQLTIDPPKDARVLLGICTQDGVLVPTILPDKDKPESFKDASVETVKSAGGKVVFEKSGKLALGDEKDTAREKCVRRVFEVKLNAGKTYTFDLNSEDFDAYLRLEDSESKQLAEDDDGAGMLNSRIVMKSDGDQTVRVIVTTCDPGQAGEYGFAVREIDTPAAPGNDKK